MKFLTHLFDWLFKPIPAPQKERKKMSRLETRIAIREHLRKNGNR